MEKNPQEIINGLSNESKVKARLMEIGSLIFELENQQKDTRGKEYIEIQRKISDLKKERDDILGKKRDDKNNTEQNDGDYEKEKAEIEKYIADRIIFTGTDGGFLGIADVPNEKEGAGTGADVRRKHSDEHYEVIVNDEEHRKSLFKDIKYSDSEYIYSWHLVDNYMNKGKKYLVVGITNMVRGTGLDLDRNGSIFASIEDTGRLPKNIEIFMEKQLIEKYKETRKKRPMIYDELPNEFMDKFNTRYNKALAELKEDFKKDNEKVIDVNIEEENEDNNDEEENGPEDFDWTKEDEWLLQEVIKRQEESGAEMAKLSEMIKKFQDKKKEKEEIENESKNESKLIKKEYDKKVEEVELRRKEEIEKMLENKAVKITAENFNFVMMGITVGFDMGGMSQNINDTKEIQFYQNFYESNNDSKKDFMLIKRGEKIIYVYRLGKTMTALGREGGFFGMSIELDNIYCTDFSFLEEILDSVFEKLVIEKFNLLQKINNPNHPYKFNIESFPKKNTKQIEEIKNVILYNLQNSLKDDFRNVDQNFNNVVTKPFTRYKLHSISTSGEDIKSINSNYFDFDRNTINETYNKELEVLKQEYEGRKD